LDDCDFPPETIWRPAQPAAIYWDRIRRRIVHEVWDWLDERRYIVHLFITRETNIEEWSTHHFTGYYRAITSQEIAANGLWDAVVERGQEARTARPIE
jgi:glycine/sarcosine N-methyltransferase